ncbi:hypothetical protein ACHWQZ_G008861 [Mnemiopsis leidyi]
MKKISHPTIEPSQIMPDTYQANLHFIGKMSDEFEFPFEPYQIQRDFMKNLYETIEQKKIGIFESPTGTGKSLSIICSVLKWQRDQKEREEKEIREKMESLKKEVDEPDWVNEQYQQQKVQQLISEKQAATEKVSRRQKRVLKSRKRFKREQNKENSWEGDVGVRYSSSDCSSDSDPGEIEYSNKIYYCSRTHSQLSQFIHEIKKSPYSTVKVTILGSRSNLCINPAVTQLRSNYLVNERCLELRQNSAATNKQEEEEEEKEKKRRKGKCEFYSSRKVRDFSAHILSEIQDIESLVGGAGEARTCPYYSTRAAVPEAEVVLLPYNMMLHRDQRKSLNVRLKDAVVIIDEAHNLIETINEIHSLTIQEKDCVTTHRKLSLYLRKVKARLKPINLLHCKQVIHCVSQISSCFKKLHTQKQPRTYLFTIGDFQTKTDLADINLFDLVKFIRESHLAQKVQGYQDDVMTSSDDVTIHSRSVLADIASLFTCLTNADTAGRVLLVCETESSYLRYISLKSEDPFLPLLRECRSVILAGGTMEPVGEVQQQLLAASSRDVTLFSCGHVIPPQNLLPITLSHGEEMELNFSFEGRKRPGILQEVGNILLQLCQVVPGGVVCFFPSYQCLTDCKTTLQRSGHLDKISKIKTVFCDEAGSKNSDGILESYSKRVRSARAAPGAVNTGAILLSVLGGRMSEGINFSDDLGRCVVVVGLPFANPSDPVLQEKIRYLDSTLKSTEEGRTPGQTYYENKCMKSVNQAIGRAIRHANDFASIVLLDKRYGTERINKKLPAWIRKHLRHSSSLQHTSQTVRDFFKERREDTV